jgi:hypothetical protein
MRVVAHDLHLKDVSEEISRSGAIRDGDREVIEPDVGPGTGFAGDRAGGRQDLVCMKVIDHISDEIVSEDLLTCRTLKGEAMADRQHRGERGMKCLMDDLSAPGGRFIRVVSDDEGD